MIKMDGIVEPYFKKEQQTRSERQKTEKERSDFDFITLNDFEEKRKHIEIIDLFRDLVEYGKENDWDFNRDDFQE